jgi:hypothetical protein
MTSARVRELVEASLACTAEIKDESLRAVAFAKVLEFMLRSNDWAAPATAANRGESLRQAPKATHAEAVGSSADGPSSWIEGLESEGFFREPRSITDVVGRVKADGHSVLSKDVTYPLVRLVRMRKLRRIQTTPKGGGRAIWMYQTY